MCFANNHLPEKLGENAPMEVVPSLLNVGSITTSCGYLATCAILANGTIQCWGSDAGLLGDEGGTSASLLPVQVTGITNASVVSVGQEHACAVLASGSVQCWGYNNEYGQIGNGKVGLPDKTQPPVTVVGF